MGGLKAGTLESLPTAWVTLYGCVDDAPTVLPSSLDPLALPPRPQVIRVEVHVTVVAAHSSEGPMTATTLQAQPC